MEPVVSNIRQKISGLHVISTALPSSPPNAAPPYQRRRRELPSRGAVQVGPSIAQPSAE